MSATPTEIQRDLRRIDAPLKVCGQAPYALDEPVEHVAHAVLVLSEVAAGRVLSVEVDPGCHGVLAVLWHRNAPAVHPVTTPSAPTGESLVLQTDEISYRGQVIAAVVAESLEQAQYAARNLAVTVEAREPRLGMSYDDGDIVLPELIDYGWPEPAQTSAGSVDAAVEAADAVVDARYSTPAQHPNPLEPHCSVAMWTDGRLTVSTPSQGAHTIRAGLAESLKLAVEDVHVVSEHVGGGFGSRASVLPHLVIAAIAARRVGRPVKLAVSRQQMFHMPGYRSPTIQRVRLAATAAGVLTAIDHDAISQTSLIHDFVEAPAIHTRCLYASPNRRSRQRFVRRNVPTPGFMRAPGAAAGTFALEVALDELAAQCGVDPVELRRRNQAEVCPATGRPLSSRRLVDCLEAGAAAFAWPARAGSGGAQWRGRHKLGAGMAAATFPHATLPSCAAIRGQADGRVIVSIDATDLGTGARTVLCQLVSEELDVPIEMIDLRIGDSALPEGSMAVGSTGTASWGSAIVQAGREYRRRLEEDHAGAVPADGLDVVIETAGNPAEEAYAIYSYGAQFAEVEIDGDTGELRVSRLVGAFAAGRILNPRTARSQLEGGMLWGLSMALHEEAEFDPVRGYFVNQDFAGYHIPVHADMPEIDVIFVDDDDPLAGGSGAKGVGELGIVGTAAAIANAVHDATGVRVRQLPIRLDALIG